MASHLPTDHADHDETLIAAAAAGDLDAAELTRAEALIAACPDCARLVRDLQLIAAATRALPAPVRSRDFRLTADQAARASGGVWGRLRVRWSVALRPLAVGMTTIGLVGMIVAVALPGGSVGIFAAGGASDGSRQSDTGALLPEAVPSAAASAAPAAPSSSVAFGGTTDKAASSAGPSASPATTGQGSATEAPTAPPSSAPVGGPTVPTTPAAGGPSPFFLASGIVAVVGVMLLTAPIVRDRRRRAAPGRPDAPS